MQEHAGQICNGLDWISQCVENIPFNTTPILVLFFLQFYFSPFPLPLPNQAIITSHQDYYDSFLLVSCILLFLACVRAVMNHHSLLKIFQLVPIPLSLNSPNLSRPPPTLQPYLSPLTLPTTSVIRFFLEHAKLFPLSGCLLTQYIQHFSPVYLKHRCLKWSHLWFGFVSEPVTTHSFCTQYNSLSQWRMRKVFPRNI